jgi:hypothetical protein
MPLSGLTYIWPPLEENCTSVKSDVFSKSWSDERTNEPIERRSSYCQTILASSFRKLSIRQHKARLLRRTPSGRQKTTVDHGAAQRHLSEARIA